MSYDPKYLKRWTHPDCYVGASWPATYGSGFGQSRDSGCLERSNFEVAWQAISAASTLKDGAEDAPQIVRESHWAVGWVEWIAIHQDDDGALQEADQLCERYENYPVLDDDHFSQSEHEEAQEVWRNCYNPQERIDYIRSNRSQFEFHDFADMLGCVRGQYFAGYASELICR